MADVGAAVGVCRSLAIYYGRPWRITRQARFYGQFLRPGELAFDIGAHVGSRSLAMVRAGARVVALEPQPVFHGLMTRIMPGSVIVLPQAAGRTATTARLAISRRHPTVSSLVEGFGKMVAVDPGFARVRWDREIEVEVTTLDALIAIYGMPSMIKIDVEAYEADVLGGLAVAVRVISFEFLPAVLGVALACVERLAELGDYRFNLVRGERLDFVLPDWQAARAFSATLSALGSSGRSGDVYARLA